MNIPPVKHDICPQCDCTFSVPANQSTVVIACPECATCYRRSEDGLVVVPESEAGLYLIADKVQQDTGVTADETVVIGDDSSAGSSFARTIAVFKQGNKRIVVDPGTTVVGREESVGWSIAEPALSRRHAALDVLGQDRVVLRDLVSRNGTFVNGRPITQVNLRVGDSVRFGAVEFTFEGTESFALDSDLPVLPE